MDNSNIPAELYLTTPDNIDLASFKSIFSEIIAEVPVSCLQINLPHASASEKKQAAETLAQIAWDKDVAVLFCDEAQLVSDLNLDGLHLETKIDAKHIKAMRALIGEDRSLGVSCGNSKHAAMLAGESGVDYVTFGPLFPFALSGIPPEEEAHQATQMWALMMEIPCVVTGGLSLENIDVALATGAEFIAPTSGIWESEKGAVEAAKSFYELAQNHIKTIP